MFVWADCLPLALSSWRGKIDQAVARNGPPAGMKGGLHRSRGETVNHILTPDTEHLCLCLRERDAKMHNVTCGATLTQSLYLERPHKEEAMMEIQWRSWFHWHRLRSHRTDLLYASTSEACFISAIGGDTNRSGCKFQHSVNRGTKFKEHFR